MFGQPMKVGLKSSNLPDELLMIFTPKKKLKENIDSIEHGNLPMENEAAEDAERSCGSRDNVAGNVEGAVAGWYKASSSGSNGCEFETTHRHQC